MSLTAIPPLVALTSTLTPNELSPSELSHVAGALQKQVNRDFAPAWHAPATVIAQPDPRQVPHGYWPITIKGDIGEPGALGYHSDSHNQPFSVVQYDRDWATTCSHELLEMLGDPFGSRMIVGDALLPGQGGRVQYLLEMCDPCEAFVYSVDGVYVSDFILPAYHQPFSRLQTPYSFTGRITKVRQVARGGYLSWYVPSTGEWWQRTYFDSHPVDQSLGRSEDIRGANETPRQMIDRLTSPRVELERIVVA